MPLPSFALDPVDLTVEMLSGMADIEMIGTGDAGNATVTVRYLEPVDGRKRFVRVLEPGDDGKMVAGERLPLVEVGNDVHARIELSAAPGKGTVIGLSVADAKGTTIGTLKGTVDGDGALSSVSGSFSDCVLVGGLDLDANGDVVVDLATELCTLGKVEVTVTAGEKSTTYAAKLQTVTRFEATLDTGVSANAAFRVVEVDRDTEEREVARIAPWYQQNASSFRPLDWNNAAYRRGRLDIRRGADHFATGDFSASYRLSTAAVVASTEKLAPTLRVQLRDGADSEDEGPTGEEMLVPLTSVQQAVRVPVTFSKGVDPRKTPVQVRVLDSLSSIIDVIVNIDDIKGMVGGGFCGTLPTKALAGGCFHLVEDEGGGWALDVTSYAASEAKLPASLVVALVDAKGAPVTESRAYTAKFSGDRAATYETGFSFDGDSNGVVFDATLQMLGEPNSKGKREVKAKERFYGELKWTYLSGLRDYGRVSMGDGTSGPTRLRCTRLEARLGDEEVECAQGAGGISRDDTIEARGDILIGGEPIGIERTTEGGETLLLTPALLLKAEGEGYRVTDAAAKPDLL